VTAALAARTLGVIGGMGPAATFDFCTRFTAAVPAFKDQDHPRLLVDSDPLVPDRNAALRGEGPSPGPHLAAIARRLVEAGADCLVMPCNTAHAFKAGIEAVAPGRLVDMVAATTREAALIARSRVGVLAADGCVAASLYQDSLRGAGLDPVLLEPEDQRAFMTLLYEIKAQGPQAGHGPRMQQLAQVLADLGADTLIAGCTEVPLVLGPDAAARPMVSSTDALVRAALEALLQACPASASSGNLDADGASHGRVAV
jgi:aspartate racemase